MRSRSGFTLIELLVVVAIIGILAAIATVNFQSYLRRAKFTETKTLISQMDLLISAIKVDEKRYPESYNIYELARKLTETGKDQLNTSGKHVRYWNNGANPFEVDEYGNTRTDAPVSDQLQTALGSNYNKLQVNIDSSNSSDQVGPIIVDSWGMPILYISSSSYCPSNRCNSDPSFGTTRPGAYQMQYDQNRDPVQRMKPFNTSGFQLMSFGPNKSTADSTDTKTGGIGSLLWNDDIDNNGDGNKDMGDEAEDDIGNY